MEILRRGRRAHRSVRRISGEPELVNDVRTLEKGVCELQSIPYIGSRSQRTIDFQKRLQINCVYMLDPISNKTL